MKTILKSNLYSLTLLLGLTLILIVVTNHLILTVNFFDNSGEYFSGIPERESAVYDTIQKYIYISAILYTLVKLLIVALVIHTGLFLSGLEITYSRCFNIVTRAEFIFLLAAAAKIIWFKLYYPSGILTDWHKVYMLSMLSFFDYVSADWYYPLQTMNAFEICYWFLLAFGIKKHTNLSFDGSLRIVVLSYLPALLIWVTTITFCTIMVSPSNA